MKRPLLLPLNPLYRAGLAIKNRFYASGRAQVRRLASPVIGIGSLSAGGAGKTPVVLALAALLERRGYAVDVLSRGYGRASNAVVRVDPDGDARRFGDEPLELARAGLSVFVGYERYQAGLLAEQQSSKTIHLLDDGFQHRRLARDFDAVLLTLADLGDCLLPAGNLREPLASLGRASAVLLREEEAEALSPVVARCTGAPAWTFRRRLILPSDTPSRPFVFTGIARPGDFLTAVPQAAGHRFFPDHHAFTYADCDRILAAARLAGADGFLITAKDAVKVTQQWRDRLASIGPVVVAPLSVTFSDEAGVLRHLQHVLAQSR